MLDVLNLLALFNPVGLLEPIERDKSLLYFALGGLLFFTGFSILFAYLANVYH